jgi:hypothetical protein
VSVLGRGDTGASVEKEICINPVWCGVQACYTTYNTRDGARMVSKTRNVVMDVSN